ncbi:MAG: T9SS type A sorting domain-containing protein [Ignavibacteria bacterium]|nr:T9SS type A sorting domain-containing protein [Ignavibacteria bacterium]
MSLTIPSILILFLTSSLFAQAPSFGPREDKGLIEFAPINEASGIAASKKNINVLWTHNDSGDSARIFAINNNGEHLGVYTIENATNRDWEDIAVGPGPEEDKDYIYVAEIGDNLAQYELKYIYRVPEPVVDENQEPVNISLRNADIIKYRYPNGSRDAETIMIDPLTKDIYIVSKRENNIGVYLASYPQSLNDTLTLEQVATLPLTSIVAGDISNDGREILLKNYDYVYYWRRDLQQTIAEAFENQYYLLPYTREPQGEAICWSYNSDGYYTVSEEVFNIQAHLYFYPRIGPNNVDTEENKDEGSDFYLEQNYPNPFNPVTKIEFSIPLNPPSSPLSERGETGGLVSLKVYNVLGEEIADLLNDNRSPGKYEVLFNAADLANGIYFYRLQTNEYFETKAMTLLK